MILFHCNITLEAIFLSLSYAF